ncbi:hypothetical protein HELRODRAFT_109253 [Helobdella robusta]|uniref:PH domain-containing protein n=1 Tax=Helobdella robusta TaxID=6412 RepID=T1EER9_HELRO|nr:hypothetical protein HELRODRAFT_109253 [Helobdella robusta]ESO10964.1 hypothetical protein HELRODRAFT_109253 [Helobdella robusta]
MAESKTNNSDQYKGWLYKWTNYIKGYQKRWFVLQNGFLSYYRNQAEMSNACRGTINLANAFIHTQDSCSFVISNRGTMTFHLKASSEVERQKWVTALELAKTKAITLLESDDDEDIIQSDKREIQNTLQTLSSKIDDLKNCNDSITKHGAALQRALVDLESTDNSSDGTLKIQSVMERANLFRLTSNAMIMACNEFLVLATNQGTRWQKLLQYEHERRVYLEDMVEQLGKQHSNLEKQIRKSLIPGNKNEQTISEIVECDEDEDDFYDAVDHEAKGHQFSDLLSDIHLTSSVRPPSYHSTGDSSNQGMLMSTSQSNAIKEVLVPLKVGRQRRRTIPERPNYSLNLWSIMKNCIGKELSKIPMPVNFSEPLSFLQRLTEDFEYSDCLDKAANSSDDYEQMAYIAAFTISSYANTTLRTGKPFNPLLGETFECDRMDDLGWRSFAEQVSHHPPMVAMYTEGRQWTHWQEFTMSSKFRGKYLQIIPLGIAHLLFPKSGNHYTWRKVTTTVHNIIVGKLWVDNHGEMDIVNHKTGDLCHLKYFAYSYFSREVPRRVSGIITDSNGTAKYLLSGTWDDKIEGARIIGVEEPSKGKVEYKTEQSVVLWTRRFIPPELEKCYNFTQLAVELNEMEDGVAPTDSRYRPDQRLMEEARWDEANTVKVQLEEKQRASRKVRESLAENAAQQGEDFVGYEPKWFRKETDPQTGNIIHTYIGEYWKCKEKQDWERCPDIYL